MCKVLNCNQKHHKHYCILCQNADSEHFSSDCPLSTTAYYGTTAHISHKIKEKGFLPSHKGTPQEGVYFWSGFDEAKTQAEKQYKDQQIVVVECKVSNSILQTPVPKFNNETGEDVIKQTLYDWYLKSKNGDDKKSPWQAGKQKCVKDRKMIKVIKFHQLKHLKGTVI